jgi:divalent metal cation (Fe/Co/Zn/Cd) transporter
MIPIDPFDLPPEKERELHQARRLELWTLAYIASSATFLGLTMGTSQAMRTSFFEDVISSVPAIAFLVCTRIARRKPNQDFPYGYHGVVSIGYLTASLALVGMGAFLLIEAGMKLIANERTTIGAMTLFGNTVWAGWPMLAAVAYTAIPSVFLARAKLKLAPRIHDKILYADAKMMKADWLAETATAAGVVGVGLGFWWLDPVAALLVSADILKDGLSNVHVAVRDLMEHRPMKTDHSGIEPLPDELRACMEELDWVASATVRMREVGHVFFGEVFVTPRGLPENLPAKIRQAMEHAKSINWRLHDITITVLEPEHEARPSVNTPQRR